LPFGSPCQFRVLIGETVNKESAFFFANRFVDLLVASLLGRYSPAMSKRRPQPSDFDTPWKEALPFAAVVMAHLRTLDTREDPTARRGWKLQLVKGLYDRGWNAEDVRQLFWVIDWMMVLPDELEQQFRQDLARFEEEEQVPYVSSIERLAKQEGLEEGRAEGRAEGRSVGRVEQLQENIATYLQVRFGSPGKKLAARVRKLRDLAQLRTLFQAVLKADSLAELRETLARG
jgi:flagellar biosynthesis/type III secretory pathway protein FliH